MNVSSQEERKKLQDSFKKTGFKGSVFSTNKGKYTYTQQARRHARTRVVAGNGGNLIPEGMVYDSTNNQFIKTKSVMAGKSKLQKRFSKLGIKFNKRQQALLPTKKMIPRVSATVEVTYQRPGKDKYGKPYEDFTITTEVTKNFSEDGAWKEEMLRRIKDSGTNAEIVKAETKNATFFPVKGQTGIPLDSIKLKQLYLKIDDFPEQTWDKGNGQCVLDFLKWYYKDDDRLPRGLLETDTFDFCFEKDYKNDGICAVEIENWCMMAQIKMIALNEDYQVIRLYNPPKPSKAKILIYIIKNCHIHPIIEPSKINSVSRSIASSEMINGKSKRVKEIIKKEREKKDNLPTTIITDDIRGSDTNLQYLCKMMVKNKIDVLGRKIKWGKSGPQEFIMDGKKYIFHHQADDVVKDFVEKCKDQEYKGQTASEYVYKAMEDFNIKTSTCNSKLNELFNSESTKHKIHEGGIIVSDTYKSPFNKSISFNWSKFPNAITFDINKCHSYILQNPAEEWYVFSFKDEVEPYVRLSQDELLPGMYFVETDDKKLFMGHKFYSRAIVQFGLDENLITHENITYQIICSDLLDIDYFEGLFNEYKKQTGGSPEGIQMRKLLNNTTTGILGKTKYNVVDKYITNDVNTAYEYLIKNYDKDIFNHHISIDDEDGEEHNFYCYGKKSKVVKENNNFAMYNQVLDNQAMLLYHYIQKLTNDDFTKLLHRKTDAFTLSDVDKNLLTKNIIGKFPGTLKIIGNPKFPREKQYKNTVIDWTKFVKDWVVVEDIKSSRDHEVYYKYVEEKRSLMTTGEGGSGKSHIIGKLQDKFETLTLAFTNCAALNVGGATIHKTFKYDKETGTVSKKTIDYIVKENPDCFIIDEDEMLSGDLWKLIFEIKKRTKIPFFLFGDWCQLENIESFNYKNHSIIKSICDYNVTPELEYHEKCRMSMALRKLIAPYRQKNKCSLDKIIDTFKKVNTVEELPFTNICYSNNVRRSINTDMNNYHYSKFPHLIISEKVRNVIETHFPKSFDSFITPESGGQKVVRPLELYKPHVSQPIICINNNHSIKPEKNGQRYIISKVFPSSLSGNTEFVVANNPEDIKAQYKQFIGEPGNKKIETMKKELIIKYEFNDQVEITCNIKKEEYRYNISILHLLLNFDMAYAMTNHKVIGLTERNLCIHQLDFPYVDNNWIYTACSRGTDLSDIKLCFKY
jgi:hypothetical protein